MVKMRKVNEGIRHCNSCSISEKEATQLYEIGIGKKGALAITCLCDGCMYELLRKLVLIGVDKA